MARASIQYTYATGERIKVVTECDESFPDSVSECRQATLKSWSEAMHIAVALDQPEE